MFYSAKPRNYWTMFVRGCSPLHFSFDECKVHTIYMALIHVHNYKPTPVEI